MSVPDKKKLEIMDKAVHELANKNPIAHELKKASHRKGGQDHNLVLATAFIGMQHLLGKYAEYYEIARIEAEKEEAKPDETSSD